MDVIELDHAYEYSEVTFSGWCPHCGEHIELRDTNSGASCSCRDWRLVAAGTPRSDQSDAND